MSLYEAIIVCFILTKIVLGSYQPGSNVTLLTKKNFYDLVDNDNIWVVNFYTSKTKKNHFAKEFALGADILKGVVKFGAIDVEDDAELAKNFTINIKYLPIVKLYGISNGRNPKVYTGPKFAKDLVESVITNILEKIKGQFGNKSPENFIEEVTDDNFDKIITYSKEPWMVLFYAPWCIHCKELKPVWSLVASSLQGKIKCASLDATVNKIKAEEYEIKAYPTIKLFPFENKLSKHPFDYSQERTVESIVEWALEKLPAPSIVQLTDVEVFKRHCIKQNICVISVLSSILDCDAHCRESYLKTLQQLGEKFKRHGWGWLWTEAGAQKNLESALDIGGFGYPALVVINPSKMKYSVFKGAFTKSKIHEFLTKLDKATAVGVEGNLMEKIVTVEVWNGGDDLHDQFGTRDEL